MDGKKPYLVIIIIQFIAAGSSITSKVAFNGGMNTFVFMFYRQALATIILAPIAIAFERKTAPPLSFLLLIKFFGLTLIGITFCLSVFSIAINYTSSTVASASINMVPVMTFFLAVLFRMETIKVKSLSGITKLLGVALCMGGVMLIAFYEGPHFKSLNHHHPLLHPSSYDNRSDPNANWTWIKGTFLMIVVSVTWSLNIVMQGLLLKEYPSKLVFITLQDLFSTFQSFFVAIAFERDFSKWKLHLDDGLLAVAYSGVLVAGVAYYLQAWCIQKKGPVFVAMSNPLALVITLVCSSFLLGELVTLGSVLGGALMVGGLYSVLWGKSKERMATKPQIEDGQSRSKEEEMLNS